MKARVLVIMSLSAPLWAVSGHADSVLTADRCQPLTERNIVLCCRASNWRDIILPGSQLQCTRGENRNDEVVGSISRFKENSEESSSGASSGSSGGSSGSSGGSSGSSSGSSGGSSGSSGGSSGGSSSSGGDTGLGNPGNHKPVGRAGEKGMANEGVPPSDPRYGTRGNSDNHGNPHNVSSAGGGA